MFNHKYYRIMGIFNRNKVEKKEYYSDQKATEHVYNVFFNDNYEPEPEQLYDVCFEFNRDYGGFEEYSMKTAVWVYGIDNREIRRIRNLSGSELESWARRELNEWGRYSGPVTVCSKEPAR